MRLSDALEVQYQRVTDDRGHWFDGCERDYQSRSNDHHLQNIPVKHARLSQAKVHPRSWGAKVRVCAPATKK